MKPHKKEKCVWIEKKFVRRFNKTNICWTFICLDFAKRNYCCFHGLKCMYRIEWNEWNNSIEKQYSTSTAPGQGRIRHPILLFSLFLCIHYSQVSISSKTAVLATISFLSTFLSTITVWKLSFFLYQLF